MAQKVSVTYACDYDDKEIPDGQHRSLAFGLDGQEYEIDLCKKHSDRFGEVVGKFAEHARRQSFKGAPKRKRRKMSVAARKRIAAAQRKRWAEAKKESGAAQPAAKPKAAKPRRKLSAAGRRAIIAATKKRWAAVRAAKAN